MFTISIGDRVDLRIDGCPRSGVEAVDFRRAAGLPDAPTSDVHLDDWRVVDEMSARQLPLNDDADFCLSDAIIPCVRRNARSYTTVEKEYCDVSPEILRAYLDHPSGFTLVRLYQDIVSRAERETVEVLAPPA